MASKTRVLIVDDEPSISQSMMEFLIEFGYDVTSASTGQEALRLMTRVPFDFAVVDMRLPDMDGETLILKANRVLPSMQYLIHTGTSEYQLTDKLRKIGIIPSQIYQKPIIDLKDLIRGMEGLIQKRKIDHD